MPQERPQTPGPETFKPKKIEKTLYGNMYTCDEGRPCVLGCPNCLGMYMYMIMITGIVGIYPKISKREGKGLYKGSSETRGRLNL
jgi:hypothetical protein